MAFFRRRPSLSGLSKGEKATLRTAWGAGGPPQRPTLAALSQFAIAKLTKAAEREPGEFVFHLMLADHLHRAGHLVQALEVARKACEVARQDPRGRYAVGTVLRSLTHAKYDSPEHADYVS